MDKGLLWTCPCLLNWTHYYDPEATRGQELSTWGWVEKWAFEARGQSVQGRGGFKDSALFPGSVMSRPRLALELPLPLSVQGGVWHLGWPHRGLDNSSSFWWPSSRLWGCALLCFVVCFLTAGWPFPASGWEQGEGRRFAPISTAVFTRPCQRLSGVQPFLSPSCPFREMRFDIPVGFAREGRSESRGYHAKGAGGKCEGLGGRKEQCRELFEFWEASSPSLSLSGLKTSRRQKCT